MLDACQIAGIQCKRLINESTAIALQYGFFRRSELDPLKERVVAFVDMGHSKTTVALAQFTQGKLKILGHKSDRNLGARDFDWELVKLISQEFAKKHGEDPAKNPRCVVRMLEACEKARKMLSSTPDAQISIDYLLNEEDLLRTIRKDEFEKLIEPYLSRFKDLLKRAL